MSSEKKPHLQPSPSWSVIPLELAGLVLRLLPVYADRACFAAVLPAVAHRCEAALEPTSAATAHSCRREAAPASVSCCSHSPVAPSTASLTESPYTSLDVALPVTEVSAADGSSSSVTMGASWLTPFSSEKVTLPALLSVRLRPPNAFPDWSYKYGTRFPYPYYTWMHMEVSEKLCIRKLILCSANLVAALVGIRRSQILICQPGALTWSVLAHHELKRFEDMAFYKGRLYVITYDENLLVVNISQDQSTGDPQVSKIGRVIKEKGDHSCYETVMDPDLLVCERYAVGPSKFEVFEADLEHSRWVKMSSAGGDHVLFLGRRCSRSVPVSQYRLPSDRVFFLDEYAEENPAEYRYDVDVTSCGAYDMILGEVSSPYPMISWRRCREMPVAAWLFP